MDLAEASELREEYQTTTEELLTSKEELQSLNEELTVLNGQLQDTLDRQSSTFDDLQNVLLSSDLATLVLDLGLRIRFFTPATKSLFGIVASDVGRPLSDLRGLASDEGLLASVVEVIRTATPAELEMEADPGVWYLRKISPYLTRAGVAQGVVITYADVSLRHAAVAAQTAALSKVEIVSKAKSRFLAAASHDLRQPLQTLEFLHGLLSEPTEETDRIRLLARMEHTLGSMTAMLNSLLDINQIEAGLMTASIRTIAIGPILDALQQEFTYLAEAKGLRLRILPSTLALRSDPRLLTQMLRNLISNAVKYTERGGVLVGARRSGEAVRLEVWDSGSGLPPSDLDRIFDEYFQVEDGPKGAGDGLGLGLAIVRRLANLLEHRVSVRSVLRRGSVFTIEAPLVTYPGALIANSAAYAPPPVAVSTQIEPLAELLLVDDDPEVLGPLAEVLRGYGFGVTTAGSYDAVVSLGRLVGQKFDLVIADFNLSRSHSGIDAAHALRQQAATAIPVIILTGDISVATGQAVHRSGFLQINKPVKPPALRAAIMALLARHSTELAEVKKGAPLRVDTTVVVVDDEEPLREMLLKTLQGLGYSVEGFSSGEAFTASLSGLSDRCQGFCLLLDAHLGGISGLQVLEAMRSLPVAIGVVMMTGQSDVATAVAAMKAGAIDYLEKPFRVSDLITSVEAGLAWSRTATLRDNLRDEARKRLSSMTVREREVMLLVLEGHPSKNIAADLGINQRTVENHRAAVMRKSGAKSIPALARMAVVAGEER